MRKSQYCAYTKRCLNEQNRKFPPPFSIVIS